MSDLFLSICASIDTNIGKADLQNTILKLNLCADNLLRTFPETYNI